MTSPANPTETNTPVDLLVVGGGLMGLGVAWRCAARGMRVRLLDRGDLGRGASWAAAGMLAPCTEAQFHEDAVYALSAQSQALWPQFAADVEAASGQSVGFDTCGSIVVALDRDDDAAQRRHFAYQQSLGMQVERMSGAALREREPLLSPKVIAGTWSPVEHQVDNRLLVDALIAACVAHGVELEPHRAVTEVRVDAGEVGGAVADDGVLLPARAVLIAGGAWSRAIEGLGDVTPPVRPVKGQMLSLATEPSYQLAHVIRSAYGYIAPKADRWVVGATSEDRGFDVRVTAGGVWHLLDGARDPGRPAARQPRHRPHHGRLRRARPVLLHRPLPPRRADDAGLGRRCGRLHRRRARLVHARTVQRAALRRGSHAWLTPRRYT